MSISADTFVCHDCKLTIEKPSDGCGTGYGTDSNGYVYCYQCCAEGDKRQMRDTGKIMLYLSRDTVAEVDILLSGQRVTPLHPYELYVITNWPGSLRIKPTYVKEGRHNIARKRTDVWFTFEGTRWHGAQYGENTQLVHCRRLK